MAKGNPGSKLTEETLRRLLKAIEDKQGRLTPNKVLDAASDPKHLLHGQFQWDDRKAGHAYRLDQARRLIASVHMVVEVEERKIEVPVYVRDPGKKSTVAGYRSVDALRADPENAHIAAVTEMVVAGTHMKRARNLMAVLRHARKMDELISDLDRLRAQVIDEAGRA